MNGDLEAGVTPWVAHGDTMIERSEIQAHGGTFSLLASNRTATWNGPVYPLTSLQNNRQYTLSVWVRMANGTDTATLTVRRVDGAGVHYMTVASATGVTSDGWTQLQGSYSHNPSGQVAELYAYIEGPAIGINYYVDDLVIQAYNGVLPLLPDLVQGGAAKYPLNTFAVNTNVLSSLWEPQPLTLAPVEQKKDSVGMFPLPEDYPSAVNDFQPGATGYCKATRDRPLDGKKIQGSLHVDAMEFPKVVNG